MIIFVGDKPSSRMKSGVKPFEGAGCEKRLLEWMSILFAAPSTEYMLFNQSDLWIGHYLRNEFDAFYKESAVIALGEKASRYLKLRSIPHFKLPHPSGRNRQINDKSFISERLAECKKYIEKPKV